MTMCGLGFLMGRRHLLGAPPFRELFREVVFHDRGL